MTTTERRYDIDWLRVIAIGLLLVYHVAIVFQPWSVFIGFITSNDSLDGLWKAMSMLNVWRIPLLFYISGMGLAFASRKRTLRQLYIERGRRILVPFLFGILAIAPLHALIWQKYYGLELSYHPQAGHLWFLGNIAAYVVIFAPVMKHLSKQEKATRFLEKLFAHPAGLLPVIILFILDGLLVNPAAFTSYANSWHGFFIGLLAFLSGYLFIISGQGFWKTVARWKWIFLAGAFILYLCRLLFMNLAAPNYLVSMESNLWIFGMLGLSYSYLNRPARMLSYLSQAAYPVYIVHMFFLFLGAALLLPLEIPAGAKYLLINLFTFTGSLLTYEFIIRRVRVLRLLFGLKAAYRGKAKQGPHSKMAA